MRLLRCAVILYYSFFPRHTILTRGRGWQRVICGLSLNVSLVKTTMHAPELEFTAMQSEMVRHVEIPRVWDHSSLQE